MRAYLFPEAYFRAGADRKGRAVRSAERELDWETAPDSLTVREAAALLRIPRNAAYEAVRLRLLPAVNLGKRRTRISKSALRKVFEGASEQTAPTAAFNHLPGGVK
jgi:excisionase family DNA binding protein